MIVQADTELPPDARTIYEEVVGKGPQGASPRGSTYWRRVQLCAFEHMLANKLRWERLPRADALDIGLLWHGCLETYYENLRLQQNGIFLPDTPEQSAFRFLERFAGAKGWGVFYETVARMLDAYFTRWQHFDAWQIVAVEFTAGWMLETDPARTSLLGFENTTRLDLVVIDHSVTPVTRHVEHKSAGRLDHNTISGYGMDDQTLGQTFIASQIPWLAYGFPPYVGGIVNITTKQKTPMCERLPVQPMPQQLEAWARSKRFWAWQEQQYESYGYPRNYSNCVRRFGRCQFFQLCRSHAEEGVVQLRRRDESNDLPFGYRKIDGPVMDHVED